MKNKFVFEGLSEALFESYFEMSDDELLSRNAARLTVDSYPGYPCRVTLEDAKLGERVLAISFDHHNVGSPYKAFGPIFVREGAKKRRFDVGAVPKMLRHRLLSLRAYNSEAIMVDAIVLEGENIEAAIYEMFSNNFVEYIHVHNAKPGCFNCSILRA